MTALDILRTVCQILTVLTTVLYFYRIIYLVIPLFDKKQALPPAKPLRYAVLIAARNEEAVLPHLLSSIRSQNYPAECITTFVIADNCTDNTAAVAREGGATVFTRSSTTHIGKGYALDYLLEQIKVTCGYDAFDAFLIFDADNLLAPDYIRAINTLPSAGYAAFCGFRNTKNFGSNWISSSYGLWYLHESTHMNRSRRMLGVGGCISGTGFGFTRELLERLGGWRGYTCFEFFTITLWCVFLAAAAGGLSLLLAALTQPFVQFVQTLALALMGTYGSLFLIGALTTALQWHTIYATAPRKVLAMFAFPLFMMTYLPVAIAAMFKKFQWEPIAHTVAISAEQLTGVK